MTTTEDYDAHIINCIIRFFTEKILITKFQQKIVIFSVTDC